MDGNRLRTEIGGVPLNLNIADEMDWAGDSEGRQQMLEVLQFGPARHLCPEFLGCHRPNVGTPGDTLAEEAGFGSRIL